MAIIRTPTRAEGGITAEERTLLAEHTEKWIKRAMRTDPIDPSKIVPAIEKLYAAANLKTPRVVIVPSPFVAQIAGGLAAAIWHLRKHGKPATDDATYAATYDAATRAATAAATYAATYDAATRAATAAATYDATRVATRAAIDDATRVATRAAIDAATRAATDAATYDAAIDAATRVATRAAIDDATRVATRAAIDDATYAATYDATRAATYAATNAATDDAIDAATKKHWLRALIEKLTPNAMEFSIGVVKLSWKMRNGGNMWAPWVAYLSAYRDVIGLTGLDVWDKFAIYEECAVEGSWRIMHEEFCIVSDFPEILLKDEQNRPHCEFGPSHRWRDGFEIYHLDGMRLEKDLHQRITSKSMSFTEIMAIDNADIRAVALKYNPEAILAAGAELIDESERGNQLYLIERTPLNTFLEEPEIYFLRMTCPTGRVFIEGVDPAFARENQKADVCQAYALGITPSQYRNLAVEG